MMSKTLCNSVFSLWYSVKQKKKITQSCTKKTQRNTELIIFFLTFSFSHICFPQSIKDTVIILNQVDVTAQRIFAKETAGMNVSTVDSSVMTEKVNLSLSDLLSENTPIYIKNHGRGALSTASFRGTAASHTQVTWNGINVNSPMTGMIDFSLIPVYIVDDLNLKHGSASIADNSGGLGGSINISNSADWNNKLNIKAMQGVGSYSTFDEFLSFSAGNKTIQSKTRVYHNYSKNNYTFINRLIGNIDPETGNIINPLDTNKHADYKRYGILQEIYLRPASNSIFSVKWWSQKTDRSIPRVTSYEGDENANINKQYDTDNNLIIDWHRYGSRSKFAARSAVAHKLLDYMSWYFIDGIGYEPDVYSKSKHTGFLNVLDYNFKFNSNYSLDARLNVDYHSVSSRDSVIGIDIYNKKRLETSFFLAGKATFFDRINLNLMLRQDMKGDKSSPLIPFLGFDFRVLKNKDWVLKGNIAQNYRHPSLNDLFWQPGGNPDLKPEKGTGFEIGTEYQLKSDLFELKSATVFFRNKVDDWITWLPTYKGYWQPFNINRVLSQGIESNLQSSVKTGTIMYKLLCSYSYTSSVNYGELMIWGDDSYGKQLPFIPLHSGNIFGTVTCYGFKFTWQFNAYSERFTTTAGNLAERNWIYPYFMNDISFGKDLKMNYLTINLTFKIYNLFDETYHTILYRPMPRRNYFFMISVGFVK